MKSGPANAIPWLQLAVVAAAAAAALTPLESAAVERWFSTGAYPHVQRALTPLSNSMPVAWLDLLSGAALAWLAWRWRVALRRTGEPVGPRVRSAAAATLTAAAAVYLVFLGLWGLNYRRVPMPARLVMDATPTSTEQVVALGRQAVARLNGTYGPAHNARWDEAEWRSNSLRGAFSEVQRQLADAPVAVPGRLKATVFGPFFRVAGVDGMINPFGLEVLANPDLLPFERPFVAAHEWAHLAGYADEAEANFVGWLTCVRAGPAAQYSGWLYLYWQIAGELPPDERKLVAQGLRDGPRGDLTAIAERLRRGDVPALRRATWLVYDSYLKANRVEEGIRSYGAVVTLILQARFDDGWRPVRRARADPPSR